jgi:hypothetical protein
LLPTNFFSEKKRPVIGNINGLNAYKVSILLKNMMFSTTKNTFIKIDEKKWSRKNSSERLSELLSN